MNTNYPKYPLFLLIVMHKQKTRHAVYKMVGKGEGKCSSCAMEMKYICLKRKQHCCTICSEMEIDEEIPGWKPVKSVGYC